jgi:hypothetical protein
VFAETPDLIVDGRGTHPTARAAGYKTFKVRSKPAVCVSDPTDIRRSACGTRSVRIRAAAKKLLFKRKKKSLQSASG